MLLMQFILGHGKIFSIDFQLFFHTASNLGTTMLLRSFFIFTLFIIFPIQSYAAQINEAGAEKLRKTLQDTLDYQKEVNEAFGSLSIVYEGDLKVEAKKGFYSATLPHMKITSPDKLQEEGLSFTFDIGTISLNAIPSDDEKHWNVNIAWPSKMSMYENANEDVMDLVVGEQNIIAVLDNRLGFFTKLNADFKSVQVLLDGQDTGVSFGGIRIYQNFEEKEDTYFSGPFNIKFTDVSIKPNDTLNEREGASDSSLTASELKIVSTLERAQLPTLNEYKEIILKQAAQFKTILDVENNPEAEPDFAGLFEALKAMYSYNMDGFLFGYSLKDLEILDQDTPPIKIGAAAIGLGFNGLGTEKGSMYIKSTGRDFPVELGDPDLKEFMPDNTQLLIRAENVPYKTLGGIFDNSIRAIAEDPNNSEMVGLGIMMRLPGVLSQAGSKITIEDNYLGNKNYNVSVNGNVNADVSSMLGFTTTGKVLFEGLDKLLTMAGNKLDGGDMAAAFTYGPIQSTLLQFKSIAKPDAAPSGKSAYALNISTSADGQVLVNGQNAMLLLGGGPALVPTSENPAAVSE